MARFLSLALLASLALVGLGQLEGVAAGCANVMGPGGPSINNFSGKGRELSQCVRDYRQKYGSEFECGSGLQGKTCVQIKDHFQSFLEDLKQCLAGPTTTAAATTTTTPLPNPRDCKDLFDRGETGDRVATIFPDGQTSLSVRCIDDATVILNRDNYDNAFNKTYDEYAAGFGDKNGDYYLGNDPIHTLTTSRGYKLTVDVVRPDGTAQSAEYSTFQVGPASDRYRLTAGGYSGDAGDALRTLNGLGFTTVDNAAGSTELSFAGSFGGGWWINVDYVSNLAFLTSKPPNVVFSWGSGFSTPITSALLALERL